MSIVPISGFGMVESLLPGSQARLGRSVTARAAVKDDCVAQVWILYGIHSEQSTGNDEGIAAPQTARRRGTHSEVADPTLSIERRGLVSLLLIHATPKPLFSKRRGVRNSTSPEGLSDVVILIPETSKLFSLKAGCNAHVQHPVHFVGPRGPAREEAKP